MRDQNIQRATIVVLRLYRTCDVGVTSSSQWLKADGFEIVFKVFRCVLAIAIFSDSNKLSFHFFQVDGEFTLNENVCDVDGLNVAAEAFSDLREASANDLVHLPNNPYTPQQLFFINTAQVQTWAA